MECGRGKYVASILYSKMKCFILRTSEKGEDDRTAGHKMERDQENMSSLCPWHRDKLSGDHVSKGNDRKDIHIADKMSNFPAFVRHCT